MIHQVELNWKGKMHFESEGPGGKVLIDGAEEFGGEGKGDAGNPGGTGLRSNSDFRAV